VTNYDIIVTLSATPLALSADTGPVRIFENDGSSEPPNITWTSPNMLTLEVNGEGVVRVSKREFANVAINYVVPKSLWDNLGKIEADRLQKNTESGELYQAGKSSRDDLRVELELNRAGPEEWTNFRQWVLENASHEHDSANDTPSPK
jgi:hypothetical protein